MTSSFCSELSPYGEIMSTHRKKLSSYSMAMSEEHEKQWFFGRYIQRLLENKGWNKSKLAKEAVISTGHISWLINGRTSGKEGPPELRIEMLIKLSKTLNVSMDDLALAYQGKDPELTRKSKDSEVYKQAIFSFFDSLSRQDQIELLGKNRQTLLEEAKRLDNLEKEK